MDVGGPGDPKFARGGDQKLTGCQLAVELHPPDQRHKMSQTRLNPWFVGLCLAILLTAAGWIIWFNLTEHQPQRTIREQGTNRTEVVEDSKRPINWSFSVVPEAERNDYRLVVVIQNRSGESLKFITTTLWPSVALTFYDRAGEEIGKLPPPFPLPPDHQNSVRVIEPNEKLEFTTSLLSHVSAELRPRIVAFRYSYATSEELNREYSANAPSFESARYSLLPVPSGE